jgi:hypothetical protein
MQKVGRNDPCPCGSGKKHKKCCEMKAKRKHFHAEVMTSTAPEQETGGASKISSLFFKSALPTAASTKSLESIQASIKVT